MDSGSDKEARDQAGTESRGRFRNIRLDPSTHQAEI